MPGRLPPPRDAASDKPQAIRLALRQVAAVLAEVQKGRGLMHGHVVLSSGTSTPLTDSRLGPDSLVLPDMLDPDAASWAVTCAPSARGDGEWTLTHAAGAPGRVLRFVVFG